VGGRRAGRVSGAGAHSRQRRQRQGRQRATQGVPDWVAAEPAPLTHYTPSSPPRPSPLAPRSRAVAEHAPKLLFLTSPNNPDGSIISDADLEALLELPVLVVLDEAYIEFADEPSRIK
jgi:aspartate/methionine/tyrosine aminotransferase